jgi:hypothetical protein
MTFSVFLGWIRSVTGTVWATSLAHSSNNVTNDGLQRLGFSGRQNGNLPDFAIVPCLVAEAMMWGIVIGSHALLRARHQRSEGHGTSTLPVPKAGTSLRVGNRLHPAPCLRSARTTSRHRRRSCHRAILLSRRLRLRRPLR